MNSHFARHRRFAAITLSLGISLLAVTGLTGCSSTSSTMPGEAGSAIVDGGKTSGVVTDGMVTNGSEVAPDAAKSSTTPVDRSTIETAYLQITAPHPQDSATKAAEVASSAGGFVQDTSWSPANEYAPESAYVTIRVPASNLDSVLGELNGLGKVDSLSRSKTDVTLQVTDINARITSLQSSLDALRTLQAQATTVSDLITVESAISQRQAELDSLVAQQTYLADQVDLSTISMTIVGPSGTPTNQTFWDGLVAGWNSLGVAGSALLVALGFVLPWLVLVLVIAAVIVVVVRRVARRGQSAATPSAKPAVKKPTASKPVAKRPATKK